MINALEAPLTIQRLDVLSEIVITPSQAVRYLNWVARIFQLSRHLRRQTAINQAHATFHYKMRGLRVS